MRFLTIAHDFLLFTYSCLLAPAHTLIHIIQACFALFLLFNAFAFQRFCFSTLLLFNGFCISTLLLSCVLAWSSVRLLRSCSRKITLSNTGRPHCHSQIICFHTTGASLQANEPLALWVCCLGMIPPRHQHPQLPCTGLRPEHQWVCCLDMFRPRHQHPPPG